MMTASYCPVLEQGSVRSRNWLLLNLRDWVPGGRSGQVRSGEVRWCWVVLPAEAGCVWSSAPSMRRLAQEAATTTARAMAKV